MRTQSETREDIEMKEYMENVWWRGYPIFLFTKFTGILGQLIIGFILFLALQVVFGSEQIVIICLIAFNPWFYTTRFSSKSTRIVTWGLYSAILVSGILNMIGILN